MVTAYYIITNSGYAVQYCILYHVQGYALCYCLLYHHRDDICGTAYCIIIGGAYCGTVYCIMPRDTQCVTAYYIICLGVCRVITAYCLITGGGLYVGTGLLCLFFNLLCYAAVLIKFTYYAQNYAQE